MTTPYDQKTPNAESKFEIIFFTSMSVLLGLFACAFITILIMMMYSASKGEVIPRSATLSSSVSHPVESYKEDASDFYVGIGDTCILVKSEDGQNYRLPIHTDILVNQSSQEFIMESYKHLESYAYQNVTLKLKSGYQKEIVQRSECEKAVSVPGFDDWYNPDAKLLGEKDY